MAVAWTSIPNGDVDVDSPLTTALITALRDNPEGIAQRATGAPKIFGVAYDYQEITANGSWVKPSNAETGDKVVVQAVGGGQAGQYADNSSGGEGAGGGFKRFEDIDDLPSSVSATIGAGGTTSLQAGGDTTFGVEADQHYIYAGGGNSEARFRTGRADGAGTIQQIAEGDGGTGGASGAAGGSSCFGAGGGGGSRSGALGSVWEGGASMYAGNGGEGTDQNASIGKTRQSGKFPGGGGGADDPTGGSNQFGDGGDGVIRVWCIREEA